MTAGKLNYYATRSGLSAGTLVDHMFAFFKANSGLASGTLIDHMVAFYKLKTGAATGTLTDLMRTYFQQQTGSSSSSLDDLMAAFYANPPSGGPVAGTTPVIAPTARTFSYNNVADSATLMTLTPNVNTQLGDYIFAVITGTTTPGTVTPNDTGWTAITTKQVSGSMNTWVFYRVRGVGETTYGFTFDAGGGNVVGALFVLARGSAVSFGAGTNRAVDLTNVAKSLTTTADKALALAISTERTTTTEAAITSVTAGWTQLGFALQAGSALQTIFGASKVITPAGASGDCTIVYPNTQATNGWAIQAAISPKTLTARVTDITTWAAQTDAYIAHRGFSKTFPEMTKFAYDEAVAYGANAIEISVWRDSQGVFWCNHDNSLATTTNGAVTTNITDMTTAALAAVAVSPYQTQNTGQVTQLLTKLSDVLAAYGDNVVVFIECKDYDVVQAGVRAALLTYLQTFPHWADRFVWKQGGTGTKFAGVPAQMKTWGYYFDTDMASFASKQAQWTYVGLDFASADATLTSAIATAGAARTIGHILSLSSQVTRFQGFGVHKFMVSVESLVPAA